MKVLLPRPSPLLRKTCYTNTSLHIRPTQTRSLFDFNTNNNNSKSPTSQTFSATRQLSHPPKPLFNLISDIDSYSQFIPYCTNSAVTSRSSTTPEKFPTAAELRIGWGMIDENFTSRLKCDTVDENGRELKGGIVVADATENSIFSLLKARWVIDGVEVMSGDGARGAGAGGRESKGDEGRSEVHLEIEYKFANILYATLSEAVMPKVAGKIIEAFERRANDVLKPGN